MKISTLKISLAMALPYSVLMFFSSCLGINSDVKSKPTGEQATSTKTSMYDIKLTTIDGKPFDLHTLEGKKILIVNTASKCGYTPQYAELQELHVKYGDSLAILGFPCNDFGGQEAGTESEIGAFCQKNYGVTFQLFQKVEIKGDNQHLLYKWLTDPALNGWNKEAPGWNFCKYLISEKGELLNFFGSGVKPMGKEMADALAK
jgi:glutathione peroxidase